MLGLQAPMIWRVNVIETCGLMASSSSKYRLSSFTSTELRNATTVAVRGSPV